MLCRLVQMRAYHSPQRAGLSEQCHRLGIVLYVGVDAFQRQAIQRHPFIAHTCTHRVAAVKPTPPLMHRHRCTAQTVHGHSKNRMHRPLLLQPGVAVPQRNMAGSTALTRQTTESNFHTDSWDARQNANVAGHSTT